MITRRRLISWVVILILGIPGTVYAVQLMQYKFAKQQIDCMTDMNDSMLNWASSVEQASTGQELEDISSNFRSCVKSVDVRKGTIEFAVEQYKRYH